MKPIRVLHVLGSMNRGGVETWLMHVLRHIDRERFQIDFLVHTDRPAAYDEEVLSLGSTILRCPHTENPLRYARQFLRIARQRSPYNVLHSHVHHFSGFVLTLGRITGIPVRIAHSHTTATASRSDIIRKTYLRSMERLIHAYCTQGFAVSAEAAAALFGPEWSADRRFRVFYCGIDVTPFQTAFDPVAVRATLGFSAGDIIFGHVGRFDPTKNHLFFLEVAAEILSREPRARFLLVGDGPLRPEVERRAAVLGLTAKIVFAGLRSDIPRLMMSALDVFLLPSIREGLPLVLMETQAAGLPCIASDALTAEAIVNPTLVRRLPLSAGAREWARVACETAKVPRVEGLRAVQIVAASPFDIRMGTRYLSDAYLDGNSANPIQDPVAGKLAANRRV
jgi:glycosyltransferase involved in cell wall biosynthesis